LVLKSSSSQLSEGIYLRAFKASAVDPAMTKEAEPDFEKQTRDPEEIARFMDVLKSMAERILLPSSIIRNIDLDLNRNGKVVGFSFEMANPFYTAESIASVKTIHLKVDGDEVPPGRISLLVRDQRIRLEDTKSMHEIWWGFGEVISVFVEKPGGLTKGKHELECTLRMRTTIAYGFPGGLVFPSKKIMRVE